MNSKLGLALIQKAIHYLLQVPGNQETHGVVRARAQNQGGTQFTGSRRAVARGCINVDITGVANPSSRSIWVRVAPPLSAPVAPLLPSTTGMISDQVRRVPTAEQAMLLGMADRYFLYNLPFAKALARFLNFTRKVVASVWNVSF